MVKIIKNGVNGRESQIWEKMDENKKFPLMRKIFPTQVQFAWCNRL